MHAGSHLVPDPRQPRALGHDGEDLVPVRAHPHGPENQDQALRPGPEAGLGHDGAGGKVHQPALQAPAPVSKVSMHEEILEHLEEVFFCLCSLAR